MERLVRGAAWLAAADKVRIYSRKYKKEKDRMTSPAHFNAYCASFWTSIMI